MQLPIYDNQSKNSLNSVKAIIAVAAGKGGVGKSAVTVHLALALQQLGYAIGIMDTDIYGPSIRKMLPEDCIPSQKGDLINPAFCRGIKMISTAYFRGDDQAAVVRAPIANNLISHFINNVQWGALDFLLIDFPPGTGDIQLTLSQHAQLSGALMVTTPQEVALLDVRKAISLFEKVQVPILGIVENMSYYQPDNNSEPVYLFGRGGGQRLAQYIGAPLLGTIPLDPLLCHCGDTGISLFSIDCLSELAITKSFQSLAAAFVAHVDILKTQQKHGIGAFEIHWKDMALS